MDKKILITGATGFIGSHLVELLLEKGVPIDSLKLLVPRNESLKNLPNKKFNIIWGDITDQKAVQNATEGVDIVYHLAALTIDGGKYYSMEEYQKVNVLGTQNLLVECKGRKIKKFILFSSIAVYGLPAWVGNIENWNEKRIKKPREIYGESKLKAEEKVLAAHDKWDLPYAIIRPTSVYGPRDKRNLLELYKAIQKNLFLFIGNGENKMDYVYVKDIAQAAILAANSKYKAGDYIIGSGNPLTQEEVVSLVAKSINKRIPSFHIPKIIALILSLFVLFISKLAGIKPMLFPQRVKVLTTNCYFDISKARKEIGYQPKVSFKEGTELTAKWLLANQLI